MNSVEIFMLNIGDEAMHLNARGSQNFGKRTITLLAALVILGSLAANHQATAGGGAGATAAAASAGVAACNAYRGKELYNCVGGVLDTLSNDLRGGENIAVAKRALSTAASQLRASSSKAQALSAISQCRAVVAGILQRVRTVEQTTAYSAISNVLAQAARLIQTKG